MQKSGINNIILFHVNWSTGVFFLSPAAPNARDGRYCNAPPSVRLSICLSVYPSVTFSFRTVTQKRIDVFSRNFAGTFSLLVKWAVVSIIRYIYSLVLILYLKCGGDWGGGGCNVFLTFYAISNISRNKKSGNTKQLFLI